jgi:hypothetical protein
MKNGLAVTEAAPNPRLHSNDEATGTKSTRQVKKPGVFFASHAQPTQV